MPSEVERLLESGMRLAIAFVLSTFLCVGRGAEPSSAAGVAVLVAPGLTVDSQRHEIRMDAVFCLHRGILEYLLCRSGSFEHESLFATSCQPSRLHAALLLIGAEPFPFLVDYEWPERAREQPSARLELDVEYVENGAAKRQHVSRFLRNREHANGLADGGWIFTGTSFLATGGREHYAADGSGALAGVSSRGEAVIQYGDHLGMPYQGDDQGLEIDETATPPRGTLVVLIVSVHAKEAGK